MKKFGKVGVLFGGHSAEREVSLMSGTGVLDALRGLGIDAHGFDTGKRSITELAQEKFERVFIALHGRYGEDGAIQGVLEHLHIPYTGSGVFASALAMDKVMTKKIWQVEGLSTPRFVLLNASSQWAEIVEKVGSPFIVKPIREGSTIGISKVMDASQLALAYTEAAQFDDVVMAEEFIDGTELTCPLLVNEHGVEEALPVIRIIAPGGDYNYENKYFSDDTQYICPAQLDTQVEQQTRALSLAAFKALGCRGWGRADLMQRRSDGALFLLEMNTSPGMTSHSLVPMAAKVTGLDYPQLVVRLLEAARLELHIHKKAN